METIDFGVSFPSIDEGNEFFVGRLKAECRERGMKFIFIDAKSIEGIAGKIKERDLELKFYLDMASETFDPDDACLKFAYLLKDAGTKVMEDPDYVKVAADKSLTHLNLMRAGIPVPFTIIIKSGQLDKKLNDEESEKLGCPFVIKPSLGYGQRGVRITTREALALDIVEVRKIKMGDDILAQEFIETREIEGTPAWFRLYYTFGAIAPCWWNPKAHIYRQVTLREIEEYSLLPMIRITAEIARITRIDWFSCEIALNKKNNEFVAVDYVNDQCWVNQQSMFKDGVPDDVICRIAGRIIEQAGNYIPGHFGPVSQSIWLPKS